MLAQCWLWPCVCLSVSIRHKSEFLSKRHESSAVFGMELGSFIPPNKASSVTLSADVKSQRQSIQTCSVGVSVINYVLDDL